MGRLAVLKIGKGDFNQGFEVSLQICKHNALPFPEIEGKLPANPEIESLYTGWQATFRSLRTPYQNNRQPQRGTDNNDDWLIDDNLATNRSTSEDVDACRHFVRFLETRMKDWLQWSEDKGWQKIRERLGKELVNKSDEIRIILRAKDPIFWRLPWHVWDLLDSNPDVEIALSLPGFEEPGILPKPVIQKNQVRILAVLGDSKGINIQADGDEIRRLDEAYPVFLTQPNLQEFIRWLRVQDGWDIFFFAGHSKTEGDTGRIYINESQSLEIEDFKNALKTAIRQGLKLAIFNSCDGLGLAQKLADVHIPIAIVMRESVPDRVAQSFLKEFLTEYASGQPLYTSVRRARERLEEFQELPGATWLPVICQNPVQVPPTWHDFYAPVPPPPKRIERSRTRPSLLNWRSLRIVFFASLTVTLLIMGLRLSGILQTWELQAYDRQMQLRPDEKPDPRLLVVEVTEDDITQLKNEHPLYDQTILKLLKKLEKHQPRVIGLDIFRDRPEGKGRDDLVKYLQQTNSVIPICANPDEENPKGIKRPPGISEERLGFADVLFDSDKIIRRHLLSMSIDDQAAASPCPAVDAFSFNLAWRYLEAKGFSLKTSSSYWQLGTVVLKRLGSYTGFYQKRAMGGFQMLLNYRTYNSLENIAKKVTLTQVLSDKVEPNLVKDKIILIGVTDPTVKDYFNTSYNQEIRGLWLHAQMVSQILSAVEDLRPLLGFWPLWGDALWIWVCSLLGGIFSLLLRPIPHLVIAGSIAIIGLCLISFFLLLTKGILVPLVPSALALIGTDVWLVYAAFQRSNRIKGLDFES